MWCKMGSGVCDVNQVVVCGVKWVVVCMWCKMGSGVYVV